MTRKSKWTLEELESLTKIKNHRIMFDGYEYYWVRKLNEKWERHFILNFKTKEKAFSYLKYNISKWRKELLKLKNELENNASYKDLERILDVQVKTYKIVNSGMPTIERINHIRLVNEDITVSELSNLLDVKSSIIYRHFRTLKNRGTLLCA
jgi:translation initiation factor IF-1